MNSLHLKDAAGENAFRLIWRAIRGRSKAFDLIIATQPIPGLNDPSIYENALVSLRIFSEAARFFEGNHGPLNASIWYNTICQSTALPDDADLITSTLDQIHAATNTLRLRLHDFSDLHVSTIHDLKSLDAVKNLPQELRDPTILRLVEAHDPNILEDYLLEKRELLRLDGELAAFGELRAVPTSILEKASFIAKACGLHSIAKEPANICLLQTRQWLDHLPFAIEAFRSLAPAFEVLRLADRFEIEGIEAVALCTIFASDLNERQRQWLANGSHTDRDSLARFETRRSHISDQDTEWRRRFLSYRYTAWPTPDELRDAAEALRQGLRGKAFALVSGRARKAAQIAKTLDFTSNSIGAAQTIERLADHVQQYNTFWNDPEHLSIFGDHWRGPTTPFDEFRFGTQYRVFLQQHLSVLPQGSIVMEHFICMNASKLLALGRYSKAGHQFRSLPTAVRAFFDNTARSDFEADANRRLAIGKAVTNIDPSNELQEVDHTVDDLSQIHELDQRYHEIASKIASAPLSNTEAFDQSEAHIAATLEAIRWLRALSCLDHKSVARRLLLSENATAIRDKVLRLMQDTKPELEDIETHFEKLRSRYGISFSYQSISELHSVVSALVDRRAEAYDALRLKQWQSTLDDLGLADFIKAAFKAGIPPNAIAQLFEAYSAKQRVDQLRQHTPALRKYNGGIIEAYRSTFAESDRAKQKEDRTAIRSRLLERLPIAGNNLGPRRDWTEMWMLKNEFQKQTRFAPVRSMIKRAPLSLQALKPCFMMSPLSLAKFVPTDGIEFDLLVIDEASQMRPEDAFGAFLRSKQIVVVGDNRQLPPTEFFNKTNEEDAWDDEHAEDETAESILDSCHRSFGQIRQLKWHYRSRCESLIAFSNREFYSNSLVTFPTARPESFSVSLVRVDGTYQARRNIAEASRIAEEAVSFMRAFAERPERELQSLGIVALNVQQRDLIQAELHRLEAGDELVERYHEMAARKGEEIFVKNLENVQGDERDYIFISLTYGKEPGATALKQRFGPINSKAGHRRLNVLFTRARTHIALFSSFGSNDVVGSSQSNEGVHVLRRYLQYAEQRGRGLVEKVGIEGDSDFETEVADRLRREGFDVDYQVGVSGFRIDLGIKHPDHPSSYLAGVECDGARFHSSKSARDRDRLREEVLTGLGWNILRVWSTDWYSSADEETRKLVHRLNQLHSRPGKDEKKYDLRSSYDVKSVAPSFEEEPSSADIEREPLSASTIQIEDGPLSEEEVISALETFRDGVIAKEVENWERQRSILRDSMIEALVKQRLTDPREWIVKIPHYQRAATSQIEKNRYLTRICQIIGRVTVSDLVKAGESGETEFKSTLRVNLATRQRDQKMEFAALRAIASLLNSNGGRLVIGVADDGTALGLETDGFESEDLMSLHLNNLIHNKVGSQHAPHIEVRFEAYDDHRIMVVSCSRSRIPVFLKDAGGEKFFMRNGTSTRELSGSQQLEYIKSRFGQHGL